MQQKLDAEVCLTGGIIRDSIVGSQPKDFDFKVRFPAATAHVDSGARVQCFEDLFGARRQKGRSGQVVMHPSIA